MKVKNIIFLGIFLALGFNQAQAQYYSYSQLIKKADAAYEQAHFMEAIKYYQQAMELSKDYSPQVLFRLGDAAYQNQTLGLSETSLTSYLETEEPELAHEAIFRLGRIAQLRGDYSGAIRQYDLYISEFSEVNEQTTEAINFLKASADWAVNTEITNEIDTVMRLGDDINTPASDNAPFFHEDALFYSSSQTSLKKQRSLMCPVSAENNCYLTLTFQRMVKQSILLFAITYKSITLTAIFTGLPFLQMAP